MRRAQVLAFISLLAVQPAQAVWQLQTPLAAEQARRASPAAISAVLINAIDVGKLASTEFIEVPLSESVKLGLERQRVEQRPAHNGLASAVAWFGKVQGEPDSTVVLTHTGAIDSGALAGYIHSKAGIFEAVRGCPTFPTRT